MEDTWIGLIDETEQGNWMFTDGTTWDGVRDLFTNVGGKCRRITSDGGLSGSNCDQQYSYICMTKGKGNGIQLSLRSK